MPAGPFVGISVSTEAEDPDRHLFKNKRLQYLEDGMIRAVARAGAIPLLLPDLSEPGLQIRALERCDGLLLSGGTDVAPDTYGQEPLRAEWAGDRPRDLYELSLLQAALDAGKPVLGICRGCQVLNVASGGTLWQDIATQVPGSLRHRDPEVYDRLEHDVEVLPETVLAEVYGAGRQTVNSVHHQAIREVGEKVRVAARASDGTIEAVESTDRDAFVVGVQWHPEWMPNEEVDPLLVRFVDRCAGQ